MGKRQAWRRGVLAGTAAVLLAAAPTATPSNSRPTPQLLAVAETRLLMEALNQANFRGLDRHLRKRPADVDAWTFARGQALLIAESGNLLLLRPPRNRGEDAWMERAMELRTSATRLARSLARQDFETSKVLLGELAASCNRCHQTFRVPTRIRPFAETETQPESKLDNGHRAD